MARTAPRVRPASEDDLPVLVELAASVREGLLSFDNVLRPASPAGRSLLERGLREALDDPGRTLLLAVDDEDQPLGMALLHITPGNALLPAPAVHVSHAVVADRHRRRGAGRALVAAAAGFAEEHGVDQVVVSVRPGSREANRFFARLGFAPMAVRRTASVAAIRRKLAGSDPAAAPLRRRPTRGARPVPAGAAPANVSGRS